MSDYGNLKKTYIWLDARPVTHSLREYLDKIKRYGMERLIRCPTVHDAYLAIKQFSRKIYYSEDCVQIIAVTNILEEVIATNLLAMNRVEKKMIVLCSRSSSKKIKQTYGDIVYDTASTDIGIVKLGQKLQLQQQALKANAIPVKKPRYGFLSSLIDEKKELQLNQQQRFYNQHGDYHVKIFYQQYRSAKSPLNEMYSYQSVTIQFQKRDFFIGMIHQLLIQKLQQKIRQYQRREEQRRRNFYNSFYGYRGFYSSRPSYYDEEEEGFGFISPFSMPKRRKQTRKAIPKGPSPILSEFVGDFNKNIFNKPEKPSLQFVKDGYNIGLNIQQQDATGSGVNSNLSKQQQKKKVVSSNGRNKIEEQPKDKNINEKQKTNSIKNITIKSNQSKLVVSSAKNGKNQKSKNAGKQDKQKEKTGIQKKDTKSSETKEKNNTSLTSTNQRFYSQSIDQMQEQIEQQVEEEMKQKGQENNPQLNEKTVKTELKKQQIREKQIQGKQKIKENIKKEKLSPENNGENKMEVIHEKNLPILWMDLNIEENRFLIERLQEITEKKVTTFSAYKQFEKHFQKLSKSKPIPPKSFIFIFTSQVAEDFLKSTNKLYPYSMIRDFIIYCEDEEKGQQILKEKQWQGKVKITTYDGELIQLIAENLEEDI